MEEHKTIFRLISLSLELAGSVAIVSGALWAALGALRILLKRRGRARVYKYFRKTLGEGILLGLELLVAADIINSVAVEPTFRSIGVLGLIIIVRTFLSFTLEVEMNGRWPWKNVHNSSVSNDATG